ncbi:unnamed protein product [marine sediment metagenome]|uniref:Uncharacterized protein n=1 Tax=marine sediment metagenome TaxID=412755 RepID=X1RHJ5_9ZZZZ
MNQKEFIQLLRQMPLYGEMKAQNPLLKIGQYFTVLKEWYQKVEEQLDEKTGSFGVSDAV